MTILGLSRTVAVINLIPAFHQHQQNPDVQSIELAQETQATHKAGIRKVT